MKKIILFLVFVLFLCSSVSAIDISVENYYPSPVEAGDYFNIWIRVINRESKTVEDSAIRFKQTFPFSLDPGEEKEIVIDELEAGSSVTKKFKVMVNKEAKEGDNSINFEYKDCPGCIWKEISMPITVIEYQTMFEVVLQEVTSDGIYIAIANIGKNPANAITVSIPEQDYFRTDLVSASIVGNLDSGDYTIASFRILPKERTNEKKELFIQIDYTDPFGERRSVVEKLMLNPSSLSIATVGETGEAMTQFAGRTRTSSSSIFSNLWFWATVALILFLFRKRIKEIYQKIKKRKS